MTTPKTLIGFLGLTISFPVSLRYQVHDWAKQLDFEGTVAKGMDFDDLRIVESNPCNVEQAGWALLLSATVNVL